MDLFNDNLDLEDLTTAKKLFHESRAGFLKLFNNSPVCMSMTTPERRYARVNAKFLEKFGYAEAEIIGRSSIEVGILDAEESAKVGQIIQEKGRLQNDYVKCITKDGTIIHTVSSIEYMEMGGETYLVSFFLDISKILEQQVIIDQHVQQLESVNRDLEAFSYSVSHDLRAPLRAIDGYAQILEEDFHDLLDEDGKRILAAVKYNAMKMGRLIDDLLAFAKLGRQDVTRNYIDMQELVREVLSDLKRNTAYTTEIKTGELLPVKGDRGLIAQVMINLVSNGIKYSSKKKHPMVEISSVQQDDGICYTIKDNGVGFDMRYVEKLFGVFQRMHSDREFEGTGVGLAIVQRIIHKHGGTIQAHAEPEKGAMFSFTLPVSK